MCEICTIQQINETKEEDLADLPSTADPGTLLELCMGSCKDAAGRYARRLNATRKRQKSDLEYGYERAQEQVRQNPTSREAQENLAAVEADLQIQPTSDEAWMS